MTIAPTRPRLDPIRRSVPATGLRLEVHHDWASAAGVEHEWDALAEQTGADISLCPAMARVWWRHYGRGTLRVLCFWTTPHPGHARRLVGVLPMFVENLRIGPVGVRVARLLGSDSTITVTSPPVEPSHAGAVYGRALEHLFGEDRCDAVNVSSKDLPGSSSTTSRVPSRV